MGLSGMSHCIENESGRGKKWKVEKGKNLRVAKREKTLTKVETGLSGMSHCVENESAREKMKSRKGEKLKSRKKRENINKS